MLFSSRWLSAEVLHPKLQKTFATWKSGQTLQAQKQAEKIRKKFTEAKKESEWSAEDFLWLAELSELCGLQSRRKSYHFHAHTISANNPVATLIYAWDRSKSGDFNHCNKLLDTLPNLGSSSTGILKLAIKAYNFSSVGWVDSAERTALKIRELIGDDALVWHILSEASARRYDWARSIKEGKKAVRSAPDWNFARASLVKPMLATGDLQSAQMVIDSFRPQWPDIHCDFRLAQFLESKGEITQAIDQYQTIAESWPSKSPFVRKAKDQSEYLNRSIDRSADGSQSENVFITMPLIRFAPKDGYPTAAALVSSTQDPTSDAIGIVEDLYCKNQTPAWRMLDYMNANGYTCFHIKPEPEIIKQILRQRHPLIGQSAGWFTNQMEVLCGFDDDQKVIHFRTTSSTEIRTISYQETAERYNQSIGLLLLLPEDRLKSIEIPSQWICEESMSLNLLKKSCNQGEIEEAKEHFESISSSHPLALAAKSSANEIVLSKDAFQKQHQEIADWEANEWTGSLDQLRSMFLSVNEKTADQFYKRIQDTNKKIGKQIRLHCLARYYSLKNDWESSLKTLQEITHSFPDNSLAWCDRALAAEKTGCQSDQKRSLKIAQEISPGNNRYLRLHLNSNLFRKDFDEKLKELDSRLIGQTANPDTYFLFADLSEESDDGLAFRKSLIECSKYKPLCEEHYLRLTNWYRSQGREDLAEQTIELAKQKIPSIQTDATSPEDSFNSNQFQAVKEAASVADYKAFLAHPAVKVLQNRLDDDQLDWRSHAVLVSAKMNAVLSDWKKNDAGNDNYLAHQLHQVFDFKPVHPSQHYALQVLNSLNQSENEPTLLHFLLDWLDRFTDGLINLPELLLRKAEIQEKVGHVVQAKSTFKLIKSKFPSFLPAIFRFAHFYLKRQNITKARSLFKRCLQIYPGHYESLKQLWDLSEPDDFTRRERYGRKLATLLPFSDHWNLQAAIAVGNSAEDPQFGEAFLRRRSSRLRPEMAEAIMARYLMETEQYQAAIDKVQEITPSPKNQVHLWWTLSECYGYLGQFEQALQVTNKIIAHNPEDLPALEAKTKALFRIDTNQASALALSLLENRFITPKIAKIGLHPFNSPDQKALELLQDWPESSVQRAAIAFADSMESPQHRIPLYELLQEHGLVDNDMLSKLAADCLLVGRTEDAIQIAEKLLETDSENPQLFQLAGKCYLPNNPKKAIRKYEEAFYITGSLDTKREIAKAYINANNVSSAKEILFELLKINRKDSESLLLLTQDCDVKTEVIWNHFKAVIQSSDSPLSIEFLLDSVELANKFQERLPAKWIDFAISALENLTTSAKANELNFRVYQWLEKWKDPRQKQFKNLQSSMKVYFSSNRNWIPPKPYDETTIKK